MNKTLDKGVVQYLNVESPNMRNILYGFHVRVRILSYILNHYVTNPSICSHNGPLTSLVCSSDQLNAQSIKENWKCIQYKLCVLTYRPIGRTKMSQTPHQFGRMQTYWSGTVPCRKPNPLEKLPYFHTIVYHTRSRAHSL